VIKKRGHCCMTFSGYVKYKDHESHTTQRGKRRNRFVTIRVQEIETNRIYWLYDWSGRGNNATMMLNHRHEVLYVQGYMNSHGKMSFAVLQRWGIWDHERGMSLHPVTRQAGYIEVKED